MTSFKDDAKKLFSDLAANGGIDLLTAAVDTSDDDRKYRDHGRGWPKPPPADAPPPETVGFGWRLFTTGRDGGLYSPFSAQVSSSGQRFAVATKPGWLRATCQPRPLISGLAYAALYDPEPHPVPSDSCGCGWRIYPTVDAMREHVDTLAVVLQDGTDLVLCGVETGGLAAGRARTRNGLPVEWASLDEPGTARTEWIRVTGPVYAPSSVPRKVRRLMGQRYKLREIVQVNTSVLAALRNDEIDLNAKAGLQNRSTT